jgi:hypothetical protein
MKKEQENNELITLTEVSQLTTAVMLQALLEEADIPVFLQNELMSQLYANCAGGIAIQISSKDAEKARNLLIEHGYNI